MRIKAQSRITNPEDVELTLTITMTVADWRAQMRQLPRDYPSWKLGSVIAEAIGEGVVGVGKTMEIEP